MKSCDREMDQNRSKARHTVVTFQIFGRKDKSLQASKEKKHVLNKRSKIGARRQRRFAFKFQKKKISSL